MAGHAGLQGYFQVPAKSKNEGGCYERHKQVGVVVEVSYQRSGCIPAPPPAKRIPETRASEPKLVSISEGARVVGLRPSTISQYVATRKITSVRIGRRVLIPKEGIDELIRRGLQPAK
jgi:excisionase family DNA binding protein